MAIDLVEWTYDPLQAVNAHFNFARLGVVVEEYEENHGQEVEAASAPDVESKGEDTGKEGSHSVEI